MGKRILMIAAACGAGGYLGSLAALELGVFRVWGVVFGALIGYLLYDPMVVVRAVRDVWQEMKPNKWPQITLRVVARETVYSLAYLITVVPYAGASIVAISASVFMGLFYTVGTLIFLGTGEVAYPQLLTIPYILLLLSSILHIIGTKSHADEPIGCAFQKALDSRSWRDLLRYNIVAFVLIDFLWVQLKILDWILTYSPDGLRCAARFIKRVWVEIHSSIRVMCMVDSALGAFVGGILFSSPIIGAVAAVVFGVVNHVVIAMWTLEITFD